MRIEKVKEVLEDYALHELGGSVYPHQLVKFLLQQEEDNLWEVVSQTAGKPTFTQIKCALRALVEECAMWYLDASRRSPRVRRLADFLERTWKRTPELGVRIERTSDHKWLFRRPREKEGVVDGEIIGCDTRPPYKYYIWAVAFIPNK